MILYQLNHNLIIAYYNNLTVTINRAMQIHNITVLIFITCDVFHALVYVYYAFFFFFFFFFMYMIQALFKVNNFQHE